MENRRTSNIRRWNTLNENIFTMICSSLGTLLTVSIIRDIKHRLKKNRNIKEHKYSVGEKVIYKQNNWQVSRLVGCEILELRRFNKDLSPCYKVKAYVEGLTIWTLGEDEILSTEKEFGDFPNYNNNVRNLKR